MRKFLQRWLLVGVGVGVFGVGCQVASPVATVVPFLSPSPVAEVESVTAMPSLTASPAFTPTIRPTSSPTPLPVYATITAGNAGRLSEVKVIDFGPWSQIISLEWTLNGRVLAVSAGNQVILIDAQTWKIVVQVDLPASAPGLAFSPDSRYLAVASRNGEVSLWEVDRSSPILTTIFQLDFHRKGANQVTFSPDGLLLASGGNDAMARVRRVPDGEELAQIIGGSYAVSDLAFSPNGEWLAIVNSNLIRLRKPESGVMGVTLQAEHPLFCVDFHPEGRWLAAGDIANRVLLWDVQGESTPRMVGEHTGQIGKVEALVWEVRFNRGGDLLASAGGDGVVRIWEPQDGKALALLPRHGGAATSVQFSPDGRWLATGDLDGRLRIWGVED